MPKVLEYATYKNKNDMAYDTRDRSEVKNQGILFFSFSYQSSVLKSA